MAFLGRGRETFPAFYLVVLIGNQKKLSGLTLERGTDRDVRDC